MKFHHLSAANSSLSFKFNSLSPLSNPLLLPRQSNPLLRHCLRCSSQLSRFIPLCSLSNPTKQASKFTSVSPSDSSADWGGNLSSVADTEEKLNVQVGNPVVPLFLQSPTKLSLSDKAFVLLTFIACTTSIAFVSLVVATIPTLHAMGRAATSLSKLADTAREELPGTMAAIRLSGMEISDLTLELSDLSQEIADGVNKSTEAVKAAEAGIRRIGALAHHHTVSMIEERASLPIISLQPVVVGAAKKTSRAVGQATKTLMNIISRGDFSSEIEDDHAIDRVEL